MVNIEVPAAGDASWLRAFHAVVPGVVRAFRPDVLVTQHGTDTHREDPLSDLNLSIDGQHTSYEALRRLADGRWLDLGGGGGIARCGWYPGRGRTCSRSCPATTSTRPPSAQAWLQRAAAASPDTPLPIDIPDGTTHPVPFRRWDGCVELPIDRVIQDTRSVVYPLHGLDPFGPRD